MKNRTSNNRWMRAMKRRGRGDYAKWTRGDAGWKVDKSGLSDNR